MKQMVYETEIEKYRDIENLFAEYRDIVLAENRKG